MKDLDGQINKKNNEMQVMKTDHVTTTIKLNEKCESETKKVSDKNT